MKFKVLIVIILTGTLLTNIAILAIMNKITKQNELIARELETAIYEIMATGGRGNAAYDQTKNIQIIWDSLGLERTTVN